MSVESLYEIPSDCICMGDGLMGMPCFAKEHAYLKKPCAVCNGKMGRSAYYTCLGCGAGVCSRECERAHRETYR